MFSLLPVLRAALVALALRVAPGTAPAVVDDVVDSAIEATEDVADLELRVRLCFVFVVWSHRESRWNPLMIGDHNTPSGSFGLMQVQGQWLTAPVEDVLNSRLEGFRQALPIVLEGLAHCGSFVGAWEFYAGGACGRRHQLVLGRLSLAGAL